MFKKKGKTAGADEPAEITEALSQEGDWLAEAPGEGQLNLDLYETDDELVVVAPVAGVEPDNLEIRIKDNVLAIRGERAQEREVEHDNYHLQETYWGAFSRQIALPVPVAGDKAKVDHENGVLKIRLPKVIPSSEVVLKVKNKT